VVIVFYFSAEDLLRTRFAISPLFEATASLAALADPARASIHLPWIREARERTSGLELELLHALVPGNGYHPDFIAPPPQSPLPDVREEIERVRRTPAAQVRKELAFTYPDGIPDVLRGLVEKPRRALDRLAGLIGEYWDAAIAPFWDPLRGALEDDIAHRARLLTTGGAIEMFADLHPDVSWHENMLMIDRAYHGSVKLAGRGLLLAPSAFIWPRSGAMLDPPWQPTLLYPPRGLGDLWAPEPRDPRALAALVGARRAEILSALDHEASTLTLAGRLKASPAGVSAHLSVLKEAGLVRPRREGRSVLYMRTATGDALVRG
jgi:hypothetical protein